MKFFVAALLAITFSFSVHAAEEQKGVFIINGKKFYSLRNARVFSGNKKPMPVVIPKQESPRTAPIVHASGLPIMKPAQNSPEIHIPSVNNAPAAPVPVSHNVAGNNASGGKTAADVLSIFEPQEK